MKNHKCNKIVIMVQDSEHKKSLKDFKIQGEKPLLLTGKETEAFRKACKLKGFKPRSF